MTIISVNIKNPQAKTNYLWAHYLSGLSDKGSLFFLVCYAGDITLVTIGVKIKRSSFKHNNSLYIFYIVLFTLFGASTALANISLRTLSATNE